MALKKGWETAEKQCSPLEGIPDEIKKLVCEALESGTEDTIVPAVCAAVASKTKIPEGVCEAALKEGWELAEKTCTTTPPPQQSLPQGIPDEIKKLVCEALESGTE